MAIPSREKTFGLENCRDLLLKLEWELDGLKSAPPGDVDGMCFRAFNAAVTAWHMGEWVWKDMTSEQRQTLEADWGESLKEPGDFLWAIRRKNRALAICREIATASKHVEVKSSPDNTIGATVSAASDYVVSNSGEPVVTQELEPVQATVWRLKVDDDGEPRQFLEVVEEALRFWTEFIYPRKIAR